MTAAEDLAATLRALDHGANTARHDEVRLVLRAHHTMGAMLLAVMQDPTLAVFAAEDWDRMSRAILLAAIDDGLVDMTAHHQAEQERDT